MTASNAASEDPRGSSVQSGGFRTDPSEPFLDSKTGKRLVWNEQKFRLCHKGHREFASRHNVQPPQLN